RVHPFGDSPHFGDVVPARLAAGEAPASLSATPSGAGYWVFTTRGRVLAFGDAPFLGDMTGTVLNGPVLDSVATPSGRGYYLVASDGGIFAFGDARFAGSMGGRRLNAPVRSLVPDGDGDGYWLVASDGGVSAFGAPFRGSMAGRPGGRHRRARPARPAPAARRPAGIPRSKAAERVRRGRSAAILTQRGVVTPAGRVRATHVPLSSVSIRRLRRRDRDLHHRLGRVPQP